MSASITRVAVAGSCFAQHLARYLRSAGLGCLVTEPAPLAMSVEAVAASQYDVYSARYGNIYTPRQLLQLLQRALGELDPVDRFWVRRDGRCIDPFRPRVEPRGFASEEEVVAARVTHLAAVRALFEQLDVLVFTLGLTEAWCSSVDHSVFPVRPGAVSGELDGARYRFENFSVGEVKGDLASFCDRLWELNRDARVLLTVSPIPLRATCERQHVLTATTHSKAVLRAAAGELAREREQVEYFPAYEIITGHYNLGRYFEDDLRSVNEKGVQHVMRVFQGGYLKVAGPLRGPQGDDLTRAMVAGREVICDGDA